MFTIPAVSDLFDQSIYHICQTCSSTPSFPVTCVRCKEKLSCVNASTRPFNIISVIFPICATRVHFIIILKFEYDR